MNYCNWQILSRTFPFGGSSSIVGTHMRPWHNNPSCEDFKNPSTGLLTSWLRIDLGFSVG